MRSSTAFLAASVLAASAAPALATCADTLYLQSLVRTEKSYLLKGGVLDSTVATRTVPLDSLVLAAPPAVPATSTAIDTARILLSFSPDCGTDSLSAARTFLVVDTFKTDLRQNVTRTQTGRFEEISYKGVTGTASASNLKAVILSGGDTVNYQADWSLTSPGASRAAFLLIVPKGGEDIEGAVTSAVARTYSSTSTSTSVSTSFYALGGTYGAAGAAAMLAYYRTVYLVDQATANASADSVAIGMVSLAGVYDTKAASYAVAGTTTGLRASQAVARPGIATSNQGWTVTGTTASTGFVRRVDGQLVRRFPASSAFLWDGRGTDGARVRSGIYLVGFEGQAAATLVVP